MRVKVAPAVHRSRLAEGKIAEPFRQLERRGKSRAVDQYRNDRDFLGERRFDLDAHPVGLITNSGPALLVGSGPARADNGDEDVAALEGLLDVLAEIDVPAAADKTVVATPASRARSLLLSGLSALMTPPNGRIDRKTFWIAATEGVLFTGGFFLVAAYAIGALLGVADPAVLFGSVVIGLAVWTWSTAAVGGKRLHDRNRTASWMAIPIAWQFLFAWAMVAKFGARNLDIFSTTMLLGSPIALWVLIDLGILKGTPGPNQYGPDPLGQTQSDPRA